MNHFAADIMPKGKKLKKCAQRRIKTVPYVRGFKPPTVRQQIKAIDSKAGDDVSKLPTEYQPTSFEPLAKCTSIDDWLAQYKEDGQTYRDYLVQCPWLSVKKWRNLKQKFVPLGRNLPEKYPDGKIYILPLGEFQAKNSPDIGDLVQYASIFLSLPVEQLPAVKIEKRDGKLFWMKKDSSGKTIEVGLKSRYNKESGRFQLCVDSGLLQLKEYMPDDALCMIALTMCDLFQSKSDLFVAGMAAGGNRTAIFSLSRYDPNLSFSTEFWYDIQTTKCYKQKERIKQLLLRSCRLLVHEINHLLGIAHCIYYTCCMNGSGHLAEDFKQPMFLCPVDLKKLQKLCGFDVLTRYKALREFLKKHEISEGAEWLDKRIDTLEA